MSNFEILFTMWEGGGNVQPTLEVAHKLILRGHRVRWQSDDSMADQAHQIGAEFRPWITAPNRPDRSAHSEFIRDYEAEPGPGQFVRLRDRLMTGPALRYARDIVEELRRRPASLVISSEMLFGSMIAAEAERTPLILFSTNVSLFPLPGLPPMGPGLLPARTPAERANQDSLRDEFSAFMNGGLPDINHARISLGLRPIADMTEQMAVCRRSLLGTSRAFDFAADPLPSNVRYVGPQQQDPSWALPWRSPWPAEDMRPLVLVAFSTTSQDHEPVLDRTLAALEQLPVRAVVTLGPALDRHRTPDLPNVQVCSSAPHQTVLKSASAVVTHAGHGTVMKSLTAGVPILCLPMGRDQNDNAARVVSRGAGVDLPPTATVSAIRDAISALIFEPKYRLNALRLGDAIRDGGMDCDVVAEIETVVLETSSPSCNPERACG